MFNQCRKNFYRFYIPVSLLINFPFFAFSEKVNAQNIKLTCDVKTHSKRFENDYWQDLNNRTWNLEIDYENNVLIRRSNTFYKGKNYSLNWTYLISKIDQNKIVAFEDDMSSGEGGLSLGSITLDLSTGQITTANHMNDYRGYAFSLHYGKCLKR